MSNDFDRTSTVASVRPSLLRNGGSYSWWVELQQEHQPGRDQVPDKTLLLIGNGAAARWGYWQAMRHGRDEVLQHARRAHSAGWVTKTDRVRLRRLPHRRRLIARRPPGGSHRRSAATTGRFGIIEDPEDASS